jgi:hypothetical protein
MRLREVKMLRGDARSAAHDEGGWKWLIIRGGRHRWGLSGGVEEWKVSLGRRDPQSERRARWRNGQARRRR